MATTGWAARIRASVTAKICVFVFVTASLLLAALGLPALRAYEHEVDRAVAGRMALPAALMSEMALAFEAAADLRALSEIVREPVVEAFLARRDGVVHYASDPARVGRPYTEFAPAHDPSREAAGRDHPERALRRHPGAGARVSLLAPLRGDGGTIGYLDLTIDGTGVAQRKRGAARALLAGGALAVGLVVLIAGFWAHRLFAPRLEAAAAALREAEDANRARADLLADLEEKNRALAEAIEQLRLAQRRLVQHEKMAAMGTMAAGVAHDLNNILAGIVGYPDLLLARAPEDEMLREGLEAVRASGLRASAIVADLLTIARGAAYATAPCDLNRLVESYLASPEFRLAAARFPTVAVRTEPAADLRPARCSAVHVQKVVMNLVMNALEAVRRDGTVVVATANRTLAGADAPAPPGDYAAITVADSGPGIPEEDLAHIFEPFFTKKVLGRGGTGLGLAVVWNTVHEHGGTVLAESGASGATLTVLLPACAEAPADEPGAPGAPLERLRGSGTVLVVDDEPQLRGVAARMLEALGYAVACAASGEEAVAWSRERTADLVLLDMLMPPGMSGSETYRELVRLRPGQRAVICSGYALGSDCGDLIASGAVGFLRKPFTLEELALAVRRALAHPAAGGAGEA